ncbi:hypothetical protein [Bradyrhizobium sp. DASA03007]|uniref:SAM domain-containing protein n=1 Tax=unclassified Bradyrhizobium TaxID=2631580 RepID=UPI003F722434
MALSPERCRDAADSELASEAWSRAIRATLAENDITFDILPDLSDQDHEKIGVASLGHRHQLLRAVAELKGAPQLSPVTAAPVPPRDVAERRQVAVMFSDLVGSTALSARIDLRGFA